jgi:hypothetical protein
MQPWGLLFLRHAGPRSAIPNPGTRPAAADPPSSGRAAVVRMLLRAGAGEGPRGGALLEEAMVAAAARGHVEVLRCIARRLPLQVRLDLSGGGSSGGSGCACCGSGGCSGAGAAAAAPGAAVAAAACGTNAAPGPCGCFDLERAVLRGLKLASIRGLQETVKTLLGLLPVQVVPMFGPGAPAAAAAAAAVPGAAASAGGPEAGPTTPEQTPAAAIGAPRPLQRTDVLEECLRTAVRGGHGSITRHLLAAGAPPTAVAGEPLRTALKARSFDVLEALFSANNGTALSAERMQALGVARARRDMPMTSLLARLSGIAAAPKAAAGPARLAGLGPRCSGGAAREKRRGGGRAGGGGSSNAGASGRRLWPLQASGWGVWCEHPDDEEDEEEEEEEEEAAADEEAAGAGTGHKEEAEEDGFGGYAWGDEGEATAGAPAVAEAPERPASRRGGSGSGSGSGDSDDALLAGSAAGDAEEGGAAPGRRASDQLLWEPPELDSDLLPLSSFAGDSRPRPGSGCGSGASEPPPRRRWLSLSLSRRSGGPSGGAESPCGKPDASVCELSPLQPSAVLQSAFAALAAEPLAEIDEEAAALAEGPLPGAHGSPYGPAPAAGGDVSSPPAAEVLPGSPGTAKAGRSSPAPPGASSAADATPAADQDASSPLLVPQSPPSPDEPPVLFLQHVAPRAASAAGPAEQPCLQPGSPSGQQHALLEARPAVPVFPAESLEAAAGAALAPNSGAPGSVQQAEAGASPPVGGGSFSGGSGSASKRRRPDAADCLPAVAFLVLGPPDCGGSSDSAGRSANDFARDGSSCNSSFEGLRVVVTSCPSAARAPKLSPVHKRCASGGGGSSMSGGCSGAQGRRPPEGSSARGSPPALQRCPPSAGAEAASGTAPSVATAAAAAAVSAAVTSNRLAAARGSGADAPLHGGGGCRQAAGSARGAPAGWQAEARAGCGGVAPMDIDCGARSGAGGCDAMDVGPDEEELVLSIGSDPSDSAEAAGLTA